MTIKKTETKSEFFWILIFRVLGGLLFCLPFIPITLGYIDSETEKIRLDGGDWQLLGFGFFLVWGSSYFGILGNRIGKFLSDKLGINKE
jgi:hypothetical protein